MYRIVKQLILASIGNCKTDFIELVCLQKPFTNLIRALLVLGLWPLLFGINGEHQTSVQYTLYVIVLRILGCLALLFFGNVLKRLTGIYAELKFNKEGHLQKMQETLRKASVFLMILVQSALIFAMLA